MSAKEEVAENHTLVRYNRIASRISYIGLHIYQVSQYHSDEGLPYSHVEFLNFDYKWGWEAGKRATGLGTLKDRYLYLLERFQAPKDGPKNAFRSKISVKKYFNS